MASTARARTADRGGRTPLGLRGSGTWSSTSSRQRGADTATDSFRAATSPLYPRPLLPPRSRSEQPWGPGTGEEGRSRPLASGVLCPDNVAIVPPRHAREGSLAMSVRDQLL